MRLGSATGVAVFRTEMSLSSRSGDQPPLIYVFSSVPANRPNYKRGVLNALCYPAGHQLELSYKKSYIKPSLFAERSNLKGRRGVFIFVDYKKEPDHDFIPIRFFDILDVSPKEHAESYRDSTRIYVRVQLQQLISYEESSNRSLKAIPGRPRPPKGPTDAGSTYFYVLEGPDVLPSTSGYSQRDIWDHLTETVSKVNSLKDCIFLSTGEIRLFSKETTCLLDAYGREERAYILHPNEIYKMDLRVFDPGQNPDSAQEIVVRSSTDLIVVSQPFATAVGGPADHSVLLVCKRTVESVLATLVVDVQEVTQITSTAQQTPASTAASSEVVAAKPTYLLSLQPRKWILWLFVCLILIGAALTSTSTEFYKEFGSLCRPELWALVSKVLGAAALALAAYLAFRKLPSGGSS